MSGGAETKTSQVSVEEYLEHFEPLRKEGRDILHVTLSTDLTGTYNSACAARAELVERYPERKRYNDPDRFRKSFFVLHKNAPRMDS